MAMEDKEIIDLYWCRNENAIAETADKYGRYCHYIAYNILHNNEDSEECVNDTYMKAWNAIPPNRPDRLSAFLGKIVRNLSLNRYQQYNARKRGDGQIAVALEELTECIPSSDCVEHMVDNLVLAELLNRFLASLSEETRKIFVRRYWYLSPIKDIAADFRISESKVKMSLMRTRNALRQLLEKEGIEI